MTLKSFGAAVLFLKTFQHQSLLSRQFLSQWFQTIQQHLVEVCNQAYLVVVMLADTRPQTLLAWRRNCHISQAIINWRKVFVQSHSVKLLVIQDSLSSYHYKLLSFVDFRCILIQSFQVLLTMTRYYRGKFYGYFFLLVTQTSLIDVLSRSRLIPLNIVQLSL